MPFIDAAFLIKLGTHEKVLMIDKEEMAITSFNWLSNQYSTLCKNNSAKRMIVRREVGIVTKNKDLISNFYHNMQTQIQNQ